MDHVLFWRPGGGLATSCGHVARAKPCKDKTKQMDTTELRELSISSETGAVLRLLSVCCQVTLSGFTSLFLYKYLFCFSSWLNEVHLFSASLICLHRPLFAPLLLLSISFFNTLTSFRLIPLQVHLICLLMLCWDTAFPHNSDKTQPLQEETVVGQRCQMTDYEHLEEVNEINANQIPLTAIGRRSGLRRGR